MEFRSFLVLIFCQVLLSKIGSTLNQANDLSIEDTVTHLKQKITQMEERLSSFENTETSGLIQKLSMAFRETEKRILEDKNQLLARMEEMETKAKDARNDLSVKLHEGEERALKREEEIMKRVSEVDMRCVESTRAISARVQDAEVRFLRMDTHLLMEVQEAREKSSETLERLRIAEQEVAKTLESKTDILQVKMNETREMVNSFVASQRVTENVIRKNISSSTEKLMRLNESLSSRFEGLTTKIRMFENSLLDIEKDYANISFVSKMGQRLEYINEAIKTDIRAIQSELSPRVEQLEERCAQCQDVAELKKTLRNHTLEITALNTGLLDIQNTCLKPPEIGDGYPLINLSRNRDGSIVKYACRNNMTLVGSGQMVCRSGEWTGDLPECVNTTCDGEPPAVRNGKTIDFERKHGSKVRYECDESSVITSQPTVHCQQGNWEGQPPVCSFYDAQFHLKTVLFKKWTECYSADNYRKVDFSRALDTGSGTHLPQDLEKETDAGAGAAQIFFKDERHPESFGSFQCGFGDERGSMNIVVQRQNVSGDLYFVDHSKVASIGNTVDLEVKFNKVKSIRWRHNGVDVPSWNDKERVKISSVQPTDAGTYECYYEGQRGVTAPALLRLIVRKCKKHLFGEHCNQQCPPCYNGGICHDHLGVCVCPTGFTGNNCEVVCDEYRYGADCKYVVRACTNACKFVLFCQPDPYGCSCARGWKGIKCHEPCDLGSYGADCKQTCHCAGNPEDCDRFTGACSGGCSRGWTGQSCQIQVID